MKKKQVGIILRYIEAIDLPEGYVCAVFCGVLCVAACADARAFVVVFDKEGAEGPV